jgi:hypothetical protein
MYPVSKYISSLDVSLNRSYEPLIKLYWALRESSEIQMEAIRRSDSTSSWVSALRNILPAYVTLNLLADEIQFGALKESERLQLVPLSRYVDERKADIRTCLISPFWLPAYIDIVSASNMNSMERRARIYNKGRVVFPEFVFKTLIERIHSDSLFLDDIQSMIMNSLRLGHQWYFDQLSKFRSETAAAASPNTPNNGAPVI